jgi:hypothetical protein
MIVNSKNKSKQSNKYNSSMLLLPALSREKCLLSEDSPMCANQQQSIRPSTQTSLHPTHHHLLLLPEEQKLLELLLPNEHHK